LKCTGGDCGRRERAKDLKPEAMREIPYIFSGREAREFGMEGRPAAARAELAAMRQVNGSRWGSGSFGIGKVSTI